MSSPTCEPIGAVTSIITSAARAACTNRARSTPIKSSLRWRCLSVASPVRSTPAQLNTRGARLRIDVLDRERESAEQAGVDPAWPHEIQ